MAMDNWSDIFRHSYTRVVWNQDPENGSGVIHTVGKCFVVKFMRSVPIVDVVTNITVDNILGHIEYLVAFFPKMTIDSI